MRNERKCKSFISTRYTLYPYTPGRTVVYLIVNPVHLFSHLYYLVIRVISLAALIWRWGGVGSENSFPNRTQSHREKFSKLFKYDLNCLEILSHGNDESDEKNHSHRRSAHAFNETSRW